MEMAAAALRALAAWLLANPAEACGALFGLLGAALLAGRGRYASIGWVAFLASNAFLLMFAWRHGHPGVFVLQLGYTCTSCLGIWKWILQPNYAYKQARLFGRGRWFSAWLQLRHSLTGHTGRYRIRSGRDR